MHENDISYLIRKAAYDVHVALGPGLLESAYEAALTHELRLAGLLVQNQVALPMVYKNIQLDVGYRLDLLVENRVIVELKTVDSLLDVHHMQLLTYLKLSGHKLGLLINFNVARIKDGMFRKVNGLTE
ncbi:GxxExxY protein [Hymenobacter sp. DH14]|uniref:GxxExxY protein n=1 Tax=Hymenobacter cyanobacteriorum TaxID=2926463 RepID=A0A9X1VGY5_9BACT|nr:GxxExxY protein [Hymenobacter cyanobacteriorum]MCI1188042.1 GxxExxY protein [Hymenobacter cyanobacteriorum]